MDDKVLVVSLLLRILAKTSQWWTHCQIYSKSDKLAKILRSGLTTKFIIRSGSTAIFLEFSAVGEAMYESAPPLGSKWTRLYV